MRPTVYTSRPRDSYPARLLRALYSAIIPGVGQLVAGVRRRGFILLAIFLLVSAVGAVILTRGTDAILTWVVQPKVLLALLWVNIVIMLVRMYAVIDAWMTGEGGHPEACPSLGPGHPADRGGAGPDPRLHRGSSRRRRLLHHRLPQSAHHGLRRRRRQQLEPSTTVTSATPRPPHHGSLDQHVGGQLEFDDHHDSRAAPPARARPRPARSSGAATGG